MRQYVFVGVLGDRRHIERQLFDWRTVEEWSCNHVSKGYTKQYCADCGMKVDSTYRLVRSLKPEFIQSKLVPSDKFHYGSYCTIRLLKHDVVAIFAGDYTANDYGRDLDPLPMPCLAALDELQSLLVRLENPDQDIRIHCIVD